MTVKNTSAKSAKKPLNEKAVLDYLRANPEFLVNNLDTLSTITLPDRAFGEGVTDLQHAIIKRLRTQITETEELARLVMDTSRENLSSMTRIHEAVLNLLDAGSLVELVEKITCDLGVLLDADTTVLCLESNKGFELPLSLIRLLPEGKIEKMVTAKQGLALQKNITGDPLVFNETAPLVRSQALVKLSIEGNHPGVLLVFGSREKERFHAGQATELLTFLARVLEKLLSLWLLQSNED